MPRTITTVGAVALGLLVGCVAADAQTLHRHARHPAAAGHEIVVHARESYLTAGPTAPVGTYNGYALDTISSTASFQPFIDHTTVGVRGLERLPNNLTLPGCCAP
ncbi:hypothetical protein DFR50_11530 [Roseiarcus fermentans]|uniref:Uncharacterized protein n=1 Tax=Roseiarcus fermentans TaxID=1473586 RepID=A0A366FB83_9HYPH|nr:hypothetical protein [Roseiarcus fermentans]RBP11923.1 hypothetical protein DFR50_11530 [Roseiarcus fermentans]